MPIAISSSFVSNSSPYFKEGVPENASIQTALFEVSSEIVEALGEFLSKNIQYSMTTLPENLQTDLWDFQYFWGEVSSECKTFEQLYQMLEQRKKEIEEIREATRERITLIPELGKFPRDPITGAIILESSFLSPIREGISGSYFLLDALGQPLFVIKPLDEDIGAINNPKGFASPFDQSMIRDGISLYGSVFREMATWQIAQYVEIASIAPSTALAILQSDRFYDLSEQVSSQELIRFIEHLGSADLEKLCSVQEFIPHTTSLFEALQDLQRADFTDEQIAASFDQQDFEEANLLLWLTGDTDGHLGNFLAYPKSVDDKGLQILGIKKIDNGLAFPEKNGGLRNSLIFLPNAMFPLSEQTLIKIRAIDPEIMGNILDENGLEAAIAPMRERLEQLQALIQKDSSLSIYTINQQLRNKKGFDV